MSILRALFLLLVGATVVAGQDSSPASQKSNIKLSDLCTLEGAVAKSTTGEGIKRIPVQLSPLSDNLPRYSTFTESSGHFIIREIIPGKYAINASGDGFKQQALGKGKGNASIFTLAPGESKKGIAIRLVPPGVIAGTVYDEDGEPVTSARVEVLRISGTRFHRQINNAGSQVTNDLGEYRIWGLEQGKYFVAATYEHSQTDPGLQMDQVYLPTFYPGTADTSQAMMVEVQAGSEVSGIDVDLREAHPVTVRGRVAADGPAKPVRGVRVLLEPSVSAGEGSSISHYAASVQNDSGDFEIRGVPPGSYNLSASANDENRPVYGRVSVDVGTTSLDGITLVMAPPFTLAGKLRVEGNDQIEFARLGVWLQPLDGANGGGSSQVRANGTFVLDNLYDGNYRLHVSGLPERYYVKAAREGGGEVLESGLTVSHNQTLTPLEIVLSPNGGRINGIVRQEDTPVSGAYVVLAPDPPRRDREELYCVRPTDASGRFSMPGLAPGSYKLFAWQLVPGGNYNDPDYFGAFEERATPVQIEEGQEQQVQLGVITAEEQVR